jgi:hypothetical protein
LKELVILLMDMESKKLWYGGIRVYLDNNEFLKQNIELKNKEFKISFIDSLIQEGYITEKESYIDSILKYELCLIEKQ